MKHFYSHTTQSFYIDEINHEIPVDSIEITAKQHDELHNAINAGCIIFDDLTYSEPPPSSFHRWSGKKWILDEDEQNAFKIKLNKQLKESLLKEANIEIDILNDKIEFDEATDDDVAMLKKWKLYRISLKKLDASDINVIFPDKPQLS